VLPASPGADARVLAGTVAPLHWRHARGWQHKAFSLELRTQTSGAEIRYTIDGSNSTATAGYIYSAPLAIDRTTVLRVAAFKPRHRPPRSRRARSRFRPTWSGSHRTESLRSASPILAAQAGFLRDHDDEFWGARLTRPVQSTVGPATSASHPSPALGLSFHLRSPVLRLLIVP
jgi:Chitobiase/beta-hexosaminidase C-terminal domain